MIVCYTCNIFLNIFCISYCDPEALFKNIQALVKALIARGMETAPFEQYVNSKVLNRILEIHLQNIEKIKTSFRAQKESHKNLSLNEPTKENVAQKSTENTIVINESMMSTLYSTESNANEPEKSRIRLPDPLPQEKVSLIENPSTGLLSPHVNSQGCSRVFILKGIRSYFDLSISVLISSIILLNSCLIVF